MKHAICPLSVVPVRTASSHRAEMLTQLLFGEVVEIVDRKGRQWYKIKCHWDNCVGWVNGKELQFISESDYLQIKEEKTYSLEIFQAIMGRKEFLPVPLGAKLPFFDGIRLRLGRAQFTFSGQVATADQIKDPGKFILKIARRYLNAPYLWGGRSPLGIDAPGFVQMIYKITGTLLPRFAYDQVHFGEGIDFIEQALPGDLAFFEDGKGAINHVGIIWEENKILHACGKVREDKIDHFGIFNEEIGRYTHTLRVVKRIYASQPDQQSVYLPSSKELSEIKRTISVNK